MDAVVYVKAGTWISGTVDRLSFDDGDELTDLAISGRSVSTRAAPWKDRLMVAQKQSGLHARRADENAINEITIQAESPRTQSATAAATVTVMEDFSPVHEAIDTMARATLAGTSDALARKPFRRARVMETLYDYLQMPRLIWCCLDDREMPPPLTDDDESLDGPSFTVDDGQDTIPAITSSADTAPSAIRGKILLLRISYAAP